MVETSVRGRNPKGIDVNAAKYGDESEHEQRLGATAAVGSGATLLENCLALGQPVADPKMGPNFAEITRYDLCARKCAQEGAPFRNTGGVPRSREPQDIGASTTPYTLILMQLVVAGALIGEGVGLHVVSACPGCADGEAAGDGKFYKSQAGKSSRPLQIRTGDLDGEGEPAFVFFTTLARRIVVSGNVKTPDRGLWLMSLETSLCVSGSAFLDGCLHRPKIRTGQRQVPHTLALLISQMPAASAGPYFTLRPTPVRGGLRFHALS